MKSLGLLAYILVVVGALNWGLVGLSMLLGGTANWNVVNLLLGSLPTVEGIVYLLVGLAGLYKLAMWNKCRC